MNNIILIYHTIRYLTPTQIFYQAKCRLVKPVYKNFKSPAVFVGSLQSKPIARNKSKNGDDFSFLNITHHFEGWDYLGHGRLWTYNLNYFDWLNQEGLPKAEGEKWIDLFIKGIPHNSVGLDAYPTSLRIINWIKFFCKYPDCATKNRLDSMYSQLQYLNKTLEYHLMGNHLLENAYALYAGSLFFTDRKLQKKAQRLLREQLEEQTLPDGANYEQSPMYHCILLDRLLDCINISQTLGEAGIKDNLHELAENMLGHLESVIWNDKSIPLLNDSAYGIAPSPEQIFDYAKRLGLTWTAIPMRECGYRKLKNECMEAIVDVGNITATYQPAHTHADTFNYELRINGKAFIVDTGISTYEKNERRQYERGTMAHNTVVVEDVDSSQVWSGFRVGKRAKVTLLEDKARRVVASHNGYGKGGHLRVFSLTDGQLEIEDKLKCEGVNYIHFAPNVSIINSDKRRIETSDAVVEIENANSVELTEEKVSTEYNKFREVKVAKIFFANKMKYRIIPK